MHDWPADMTTAVQGVYPSSLSDLEVKVQMHGPSSDTAHHSTRSRQGSLMRFVADQGHNHAVQVEEEHQEVETQFDERFLHRLVTHICVRKQKKKRGTHLLVHVQLAEDLRRIQQMLVLVDPGIVSCRSLEAVSGVSGSTKTTYFFALNANSGRFSTIATQYPLMINRKVRNPWTAASGTM